VRGRAPCDVSVSGPVRLTVVTVENLTVGSTEGCRLRALDDSQTGESAPNSFHASSATSGGSPVLRHIPAVYGATCAIRASTRAFGRF
jgi:hypothetical protein